jgi:choline dehydrogenase-like flavoprotein
MRLKLNVRTSRCSDDWPMTYEDLEPYYVRVERDFG